MSIPLRLIVFDVDGTLIDSQAHIVAAMDAAFARAGRAPPPRARTLSIVGLSLPVAIRELAPELDDGESARIVEHYKQAYAARRQAHESPLYPGALAALKALAARPEALLGVATGKSRRGLDHLMGLHDLRQHFVTTQVADDHPSKPHPSMLEAALRETGAQARHGVMIGDTSFDMEMGRAAGLRTIGVGWGYHAADRLATAGAERVIGHFDELSDTLDTLWKETA
ncbi:HAD family hydrolase [Rhodobacteraceae bacterium WD3A24]|nr:HAD family hydrolase [Rhodobacteraceae bacterium WD3A24]